MSEIELPEPAIMCDCGGNYYTAEQVRQAVMAERARCARVAEDEKVDAEATGDATDAAYNVACEQIAAAIRRG